MTPLARSRDPYGAAIQRLERLAQEDSRDSDVRFELAVLLLNEFVRHDDATVLHRARARLLEAVRLCPTHAPSHAALGYTYDADREVDAAAAALASWREALRLQSTNRVYQVYVVALVCETSPDDVAMEEVRALARRQQVDLDRLEREIAEAGMPNDARTLLSNAFISPRNFFRSWLADEETRILRVPAATSGRRRRHDADRSCRDAQRALAQQFSGARVPAPLRALAASARRLGVGDDVCRPRLVARLTTRDRDTLVRNVQALSPAIHAWLDSFGDAPLSTEAAAFMYLALAVEELDS